MDNHIFRSSLNGFNRQDVTAYIEKSQREAAERVAELETQIELLRKSEEKVRSELEKCTQERDVLCEQLAELEKKAQEANAQADAAAAKAREETAQEAEAERKKLELQIKGLQRKLQTAADPKVQKFGVYFEQLQATIAVVSEIVATIEDTDLSERFRCAMCELARQIESEFAGEEEK